jgi:DNA-binding MarR family transcriptional regulator
MRKQVDNVNHSSAATAPASGSTPGKKAAASADAVLDLVHTVMHQFRSRQYQVLRDGPYAVTHMDSKVMGFFAHHPGATLSDLAQHSGRDKAQLARLVKGLRERELLVGEPDAADRRNVRLRLSEPGRTVQEALRREGRALNERAVAGLSITEQATLVDLLARVKANLDAPD